MPLLARIDFDLIPAEVVGLCQTLRGAGHECYLVGGGVRDLLLGRPVHDWDVATAARPAQVQRLFARTVPTGIRHGTVTVLLSTMPVEVTTFRGESGYGDGRHPDEITFLDSIEADLSRRDFTINAMALDPVARLLLDPFSGCDDLRLRLVRAVGDAGQRFNEDGLRTMRAVRFAAVLEFSVEPETLAAIPSALSRFRLVSSERVRDELLKLLAAPRPAAAIELMRASGLLAAVLPELVATYGLRQNRFHVEDVYEHSLHVCDRVGRDPILRLAALLHDVGKPVTTAPHPSRHDESSFHGHELEGARLADEIGRRLRLSNQERERVSHLVAHHMIPTGGWTAGGLRRFLRRVGEASLDDLFELRAADLTGRPESDQRLVELQRVRRWLEDVRSERRPLQVSELAVGGREVMERLGVGPGPRVGAVLRALLERVIDDPSLNEREKLLALAEQLVLPQQL